MNEIAQRNKSWRADINAFRKWMENREDILEPGLLPEPTIKVLAFFALLDTGRASTYDDLREVFRSKRVVIGEVPDNTLRTSILNLGKCLEKFKHPFALKSFRGSFKLIRRNLFNISAVMGEMDDLVVTAELPVNPVQIARTLIEKAMLSSSGLYLLDWSARWWETYSAREAEIRVEYEAEALNRLDV